MITKYLTLLAAVLIISIVVSVASIGYYTNWTFNNAQPQPTPTPSTQQVVPNYQLYVGNLFGRASELEIWENGYVTEILHPDDWLVYQSKISYWQYAEGQNITLKRHVNNEYIEEANVTVNGPNVEPQWVIITDFRKNITTPIFNKLDSSFIFETYKILPENEFLAIARYGDTGDNVIINYIGLTKPEIIALRFFNGTHLAYTNYYFNLNLWSDPIFEVREIIKP